jgi:thiamine-phosphate pyrophosphorylase
MILDRFYPIFDNCDWLRQMLPLGVKFVQLRIKDAPLDIVRREIIKAKALCDAYGAVLVVNDYWHIAIDVGCDWVHLGQEDMDDADLNAIRCADIKLGFSTHDDDELERALGFAPDYLALGPVYPTILKKMKWHQQGLPRLTEWKGRIGNIPLVGIGGMRVDRAAGVFAAGADIISVVTDITLHDDPEARVKSWLEVTQ